MIVKPQEEHAWLERFVGEWSSECEATPTPGQPGQVSRGVFSGRMLGGLWLLGEGHGDGAQDEAWGSLLTLGYDPEARRYVGSFIGSRMSHHWVYTGQREGDRLALVTHGPSLDGQGMSAYQDVVELLEPDHWVMKSSVQGAEGSWHTFMTAHFHQGEGSGPAA